MNLAFSWANRLRYGALGLPLAFVALPLYVLLPNHYAKQFGMPLALLGGLLLGARLFDALIDPLLGRWVDALFARGRDGAKAVLAVGSGAGVVLCAGFAMLFLVPQAVAASQTMLVFWLLAGLLVTYVSFSLLSVAHQAWAARLGGSEVQRSQIVAVREGLGLFGVVLASILPSVSGFIASVAVFFIAIAMGLFAWSRSVQPPVAPAQSTTAAHSLWQPFANPAFVKLFVVFVLNGIASAVPATLLLFFVQDRLQATPGAEGPMLAAYFVCAAASLPLWLALVRRLGLERTWLVGMVLAIAVFVWAAGLGKGDIAAFYVVCALSGVALAADLAVPSALLAGIIAKARAVNDNADGIHFGWWNFAAKLNLALAAGAALPLLAWFGYTPGARDAQALQALTVAYCLLPCVLKALAALALWRWLLPNSSKDVS